MQRFRLEWSGVDDRVVVLLDTLLLFGSVGGEALFDQRRAEVHALLSELADEGIPPPCSDETWGDLLQVANELLAARYAVVESHPSEVGTAMLVRNVISKFAVAHWPGDEPEVVVRVGHRDYVVNKLGYVDGPRIVAL